MYRYNHIIYKKILNIYTLQNHIYPPTLPAVERARAKLLFQSIFKIQVFKPRAPSKPSKLSKPFQTSKLSKPLQTSKLSKPFKPPSLHAGLELKSLAC